MIHSLPATLSRRRSKRRHRPLVLSATVGLALCAGVWLVADRLASRRSRSAPPPAAAANVIAPTVMRGPVPAAVAENFIHAATQAERLKWVRDPALVAPAMEEFFSSGRGARETVASLGSMRTVDTGGGTFARFAVSLADGGQRLACVVIVNGEAKVDFKAYARYGSATWENLLDGGAKEASEVRIFIQKANYYNFEFSHEVRWQNFTATSPDLDASVQLYIARNHPDAKRLANLASQGPVRATVAIRAVEDSHLKRQFEITRFLGAGWVLEN